MLTSPPIVNPGIVQRRLAWLVTKPLAQHTKQNSVMHCLQCFSHHMLNYPSFSDKCKLMKILLVLFIYLHLWFTSRPLLFSTLTVPPKSSALSMLPDIYRSP